MFFRGYHCVQPTATRMIIPKGMQPIRMAPHPHSGVAVTAGELPLAPTLHVVHQRIHRDYIKKNTLRFTPRSCRGDWEVARPSAWRTHPYSEVAVTAGELPLAPTLHVVNQ